MHGSSSDANAFSLGGGLEIAPQLTTCVAAQGPNGEACGQHVFARVKIKHGPYCWNSAQAKT